MAAAISHSGEFLRVIEALGLPRDACIDPRSEMLFAEGVETCAQCRIKQTCKTALDRGRIDFRTLTSLCPNADLIVELLYGRQLWVW